MRAISLAVLSALLISGCANMQPLTREKLATIDRNTPMAEVSRRLEGTRVDGTARFEVDGVKYTAQGYSLVTGTRQEMTMVCGQYGCIPVSYPVDDTSPYVMLFKGEPPMLLAWGLVEELSKSEDAAVSGLMPRVKEELSKAKK